jgi:alpha-beta hydrolase superfamily lysophospholipase
MNCQVIKIKTPKKYLLDALYFGPLKADRLFIFVHGLGSNLFSKIDLFESLVDKKTAVLAFNNRGYGAINRVSREDKRTTKGYINHTIGFSHETFSDCVDDLEGAVNFALKTKAKSIFLIGHSTGCQKTVYYLAKKQKSPAQGAILLAPMSDYASMFLTLKALYIKN